MGLEMPDEPVNSYEIYSIINTFYLANRSRGYLSGMSVMPLPIGVNDISNVVSVYPVLLERDVLDTCVFAIDDIYLEEVNKKPDEAENTETE